MFGLNGDGDRGNNALSNLRWGTRIDNNADGAIHGGASAKLLKADIHEIRSSTERKNDLAVRFGVNRVTIWKVQNRKIGTED